MTSREIRQSFLDFFASKNHKIVPSAPVIPHGDPTLLFTNAGMNQFKDVFLGQGKRDFTRCADTQKCIRVSGKHNDLEEVGYDTYHHTLFEMLGNWSFGDYYKSEAIAWAWELLTDVWKLPKERLHATVFRTDDEAYSLWTQFLPPTQIHYFDEKDNFWEMGDTGPCGPCSEIHFDRTPDLSGGPLVNAGVPEVIEIWNLVFIQYNRLPDRSLQPLAQTHVDTGMGFERICAVMQGKFSNYDTDVFSPIIEKIESFSGKQYSTDLDNKDGIAMRVIADHIRTLAFAIADGAVPSNDGRGYVLRRILRRASKYARNLGFHEPFLFKLVEILAQTMGDIFPEIHERRAHVELLIKNEEESFLLTLDRGIEKFDNLSFSDSNVISGADAFQLYDTFGFPLDLTELLARERGCTVDVEGYSLLLEEQKQRSRNARKKHVHIADMPTLEEKSEFIGWNILEAETKVLYANQDQIVLDKTPFYVEMGGQISDTGALIIGGNSFEVLDVRKSGDAIVHFVNGESDIVPGDNVIASVHKIRRFDIQRNHSATHLLHEALRKVLGSHVQQAGSLVSFEHLRFDFSHFQKLDQQQIVDIETLVNEKIRENIQVQTMELALDEAKKIPGAKMFFGDKYGEKVRVVIMDEKFSVEFCGGTHVSNTSEIGLFTLVGESSVASGVRRIEAVTSTGIINHMKNLHKKITDAHTYSDSLQAKIHELEKELSRLKVDSIAQSLRQSVFNCHISNGVKVVAEKVPTVNGEEIKLLGDTLRELLKTDGIGLLASEQTDGKVLLACVVSDNLTSQYSAGKLVGAVAKKLGGGGGGKAHLATAGAKDASKIQEILREFIENF
jgi:alanyl-tRNA synthetase